MAGGILRLQLDVPTKPNELDLILDQERTTKADDEAELAQNNRFLLLTDADLAKIGLTREVLVDRNDTLNARILAYGWPRHNVTLNVVEGDWLSPGSVQSFCGETSTNVATNSIDGDTGTHWRHVANERHSIVYKLRDFPLRVEKIRFFYNASLPVNEQLTNLDVHMAKALVNIDDAGNILESGLNLTWPGTGGVFVDHTLATPKASAVYIKLVFDTASAVNTGQIREFEVFCTPRKA